MRFWLVHCELCATSGRIPLSVLRTQTPQEREDSAKREVAVKRVMLTPKGILISEIFFANPKHLSSLGGSRTAEASRILHA